MSELAAKQCIPCRGGVPPLEGDELQALRTQLGGDWAVVDDHHLEKAYGFDDFRQALDFTVRVGRDGRGTRPSPGHPPDLGQGERDDLDPQDQRSHGKRFRLCCQG